MLNKRKFANGGVIRWDKFDKVSRKHLCVLQLRMRVLRIPIASHIFICKFSLINVSIIIVIIIANPVKRMNQLSRINVGHDRCHELNHSTIQGAQFKRVEFKTLPRTRSRACPFFSRDFSFNCRLPILPPHSAAK